MKYFFTFLVLLPLCKLSLLGQFTLVGSQLDGNAPNDNFGWSVAMDTSGKTIAVGAPLYDNDFGQVRVYHEFGGIWTQVGGDIEGVAIANQLGFSLALNANATRLAIGGIGGLPGNGGQARVYQLDNGNWVQMGNSILAAAAGDQFGFSLDMDASGNRIIVSGRNNNGNANEAGHVRVYEFQNNDWVQLGIDLEGEAMQDRLGTSVSMSADGNIIAASSATHITNGQGLGQVKVWQWQNNAWAPMGNDIIGLNAGELFGFNIDLSNDGLSLVVAAPLHDHGNGFGSSRVFTFDNNTWTQLGNDMRASSNTEAFGEDVAISGDGNRVVLGTKSADDVALSSGRANVYELDNGTWVELYNPLTGQAQFDNLGKSVAMNNAGNRFVVGANLAGGTQGYTHVYEDSQMPVSIESLRERLGLVIAHDIMEESLTLRFAERQSRFSARLSDINGRVIIQKAINGSDQLKFTYSLPHGLYLLQIQTSEGMVVKKIRL